MGEESGVMSEIGRLENFNSAGYGFKGAGGLGENFLIVYNAFCKCGGGNSGATNLCGWDCGMRFLNEVCGIGGGGGGGKAGSIGLMLWIEGGKWNFPPE